MTLNCKQMQFWPVRIFPRNILNFDFHTSYHCNVLLICFSKCSAEGTQSLNMFIVMYLGQCIFYSYIADMKESSVDEIPGKKV